jgi:integrase
MFKINIQFKTAPLIYPKNQIIIIQRFNECGQVIRAWYRRTLATILVDAGLPYHQVMKITGHKKLTTFQKYIKSEADIDEMVDVGK